MNPRIALKEAAITALISTVLVIPVVGMVLKDRELEIHLSRAFVLVGLVFVGRLTLVLMGQRGMLTQLHNGVEALGARLSAMTDFRLIRHRRLMSGLGLAVLLTFPFAPFTDNYLLQISSLTLIYVLLATGLNIVVGLAGLLDLGFVAFYAVGAYSYALMAQHLGLGFWMAFPIAATLAASAGCVLGFPVLKMHGDYLAIVTLGFGEIIRILLVNMITITGGPNGMSAPRPNLFGLTFTNTAQQGEVPFHTYFGIEYSASHRYIYVYLVALLFTLLAIFIFRRLREMPIGRAWEALREDETACKALGINHTTTKLSAFTLGAAFGGVGGVLYAAMEGFINPSSFTFIESAIILAIVVLGGMGSIAGVVIAAICVTLLPELFRGFEQYRMLVFGLAITLIMIWRPSGLLKVRRKSFVADGHAD